MRKSLRSRGFTLLELLVGAAVGAVVLAGISLTFISQAQQYQAHASRRGVQANARQALAFMSRHLRIAGYGINPDRAVIPYDSFNATSGPFGAQDQNYPDAFVVHWRDALFRRSAQTVNPALITLPASAPLKTDLRKGQILLVMCSDPSLAENPPHAYVTVGAFVASGGTSIPLDQTPAPNAPNTPIGPPGRFFHEQATGLANPCFNSAPYVLLVHRAAFFVAMYDDDGNPATPERTPYLMLHQGLDMPTATDIHGDGAIDINDAVPVAEGIEQLQLAYILYAPNPPPPKPPVTPRILGVEAPMLPNHYGENWEQIDPIKLPTGWYTTVGFKFLVDPDKIPELRTEDHPVNIRQVRMTVTSRSSLPDPQIVGDDLLIQPDGNPYPDGAALGNGALPWKHLENLAEPMAPDFRPAGGHFYRALLRESITPKNLLLNRQFAPVTKGGG